MRNHVAGSPERPRLSVYRSGKHIYAQVIDDVAGRTLVSAASTSDDVRGDLKTGANLAAAQRVGRAIADRAKAAGVTQVAFDRGGAITTGGSRPWPTPPARADLSSDDGPASLDGHYKSCPAGMTDRTDSYS